MRRYQPDLLIVILLFLLPLAFFWQQTLGGRTLLPTENIYQFEPFATYREVVSAPDVPHNALLSDLVLQNYQWKSFIRESIHAGELPLWNPHQFAGIPFFAAGQQSTLYPLSAVYYILPLPSAYGWFTVLNLWLAGAFMYAFARGLGIRRAGSLVAGVTYQLSAFFLISAVFPMIIASAAWLPLLLLMVEFTIRRRTALRGQPATIPWVAIGALALGFNILAGHVEITYYTLIIMAYYAAARLLYDFWRKRRVGAPDESPLRLTIKSGAWLLGMVALGIGLGAAQFIPLFEFASINFRDGSATFAQVRGWAHPARDLLQFALPNFYGNPSHHSYFDVFRWETVPATVNALGNPIDAIDWGVKNYVEGALYLGVLPLLLAAYGLFDRWILRRKTGHPVGRPYHAIFAILALASLTFMFGMLTYGALFFTLPGFDQLHTPFRWIFGLTLSAAVLAGFGMDALTDKSVGARRAMPAVPTQGQINKWPAHIGYALITFALTIVVALFFTRLFYDQSAALVARIFERMANATAAFPDARAFYSYEMRNVAIFAFFLLGSGLVFWLAGRKNRSLVGASHASPVREPPLHPSSNPYPAGVQGLPTPAGSARAAPSPLSNRVFSNIPIWQILAVILVAADLMAASWGFNPASDPLLLDFTPPAVEWLQAQEGDWRFFTLDDPAQRPLMQANLGWRFGLDDARGYESIIPKQYVDYMRQLAPQNQLDFNRVAPLFTTDLQRFGSTGQDLVIPSSPLISLLNVRYIITHKSTELRAPSREGPFWPLVYEDEAVRIRENPDALPRAYTVSANTFDPQAQVIPAAYSAAAITRDTGREKFVDVAPQAASWLVVSETHLPGWRAFIRPLGAEESAEQPLAVELVQGNFQGVFLPDPGQWTLRLVYSPTSFQVGLFASFISVVLLIFITGVWLWQLFIASAENNSEVSRVARNSVAPIVLNLFNRFIDFAFAFVMLRILGPEDAGIYYYAIIVFGWFDIFTNFGLNIFLTREVARDHARAWRYFYNTSILRLLLAGGGVPLLIVFLGARQAAIDPPLTTTALVAISLLYIGLIPNSLSNGMSALFYAFEKAEYPAAIAAIATISKAVFGVGALLLGYGVVGLAGVSIITNLITFSVMIYGGRDLFSRQQSRPRLSRPDFTLMRGMVGESWPLMLNHFLAQIFFQIDVVIIEAIRGARMVGQYSVAYKWVLALNVIPAFFTQAMLPLMSRQALADRDALKRNYRLSIKLLVSVALPTAALFTFLAEPLTFVLGGSQFLPEGGIALQLMIWSIPIGWMNSLTQYVLIALDMQRRITRAFFLGVTFNIVANLIFVPQFGFQAAAVTTIASEAILFVPFALLLREALGSIGWRDMLWRPILAAAAMLAALAALWGVAPVLALTVALAVYPVTLLALRPLTADEIARLTPLLPARLRAVRVVVPGR